MDAFYELMDEYLNHDRRCPDCGEKMWVCYCDGHVSDKCFDCPEKEMTLEGLASGDFTLDFGYITNYPEPEELPPETFEIRDYSNGNTARLKKHERAYRKKT